HEDSLFGSGTAALLSKSLPQHGFEIVEVVKHPNPTRDFNNIVLRMRSVNPDIDRKSTRLNSSHVKISYAVFCLKKKSALQLRGLLLDSGRSSYTITVFVRNNN